MMSILGAENVGYCSQKRIKKEGITALLASNISKCFFEYCCNDTTLQNRVVIMHQNYLKNKNMKDGSVDVSLFYRFESTDTQGTQSSLGTSIFPLVSSLLDTRSTCNFHGLRCTPTIYFD